MFVDVRTWRPDAPVLDGADDHVVDAPARR